MRKSALKLWFLGSSLVLASVVGGACSSNESGGSSSSSSSSGSGGSGGDPTPAESCTRPGDKGNNKGVGEYCTPFGGQCTNFPGAPLCLADVGETEWMCTRISCDATTDCGEGAGCLIENAGSACVPCRCDNRGIGCTDGGMGGMGGTGGAGGAGGMGGAGGG